MRIARRLPILALFLATLLVPEAFAWAMGICDDWPTATVHHELGLEVRPGQVDTQIDRIRTACVDHPEFACTVISNAAAESGRSEGKLTLRLAGAAVAALSAIAAVNARITGQIMRQDIEQSEGLPEWIAFKSAHRARINALLDRGDLTDAQRATLKQELMRITLQIAKLTAAKEELRPRPDSDTLYIRVVAAR
jgi:hypothetical protein